MTPIRKTLIEIQKSQSFDQLTPFKEPTVWRDLPSEERVLLAQLLVLQGAQQLAQGSPQALDSFDTASQVSADNPQILLQQATVLSSHCRNMRCLTLATQILTRVLEANPEIIRAWVMQAYILTEIALFENEASIFQEADKHFKQACSLFAPDETSIDLAIFYGRWGFSLASLGNLSGEPHDYYQAIEKFHRAYEFGCRSFQFHLDFGHSYADLAALLEKPEYFTEALKLFNQAVISNPQAFEGWYNQACCLQCLMEFTRNDQLFEQAEKSFERAVEIQPDVSQVWLKWGQVLTTIGKSKRDYSKVELSLEKFAKAYQLDSGHPQILTSWAETLLFLGSQEERLDLIHEARHKILTSLEILPDDPHAWYLYGSCFNELGRYFSHEESYHQAIEKFQYGLSLSQRTPLLWYGLALAQFALGELTEQQPFFEKAVRYCSRVIESGGAGFAQFWNDWGVALLKLAEMSEQASHVEMAIEKFERALKQPIESIEEGDVDLEWVYNYGSAYDLLGELTEEPAHSEKAVQILSQVVQLEPDYALARYNLALALAHLGEALYDVELYQKAIEHFQVLLNQDPEDEMIHLDYGMSLTHLGLLIQDVNHPEPSQSLFKLAETHFIQASFLGNTQSYYQLAGLYSLLGQLEQSMHYLERAQAHKTLPGIDDLMHDEWLDSVRQIPAFRQFINELSSKQSTDEKA